MKLFDFQEQAVTQLLHEQSCLIGDDMGLGKTVEAIVLDNRRRLHHSCWNTAKTLVVTVTSMMGAWRDHFEEWAPDRKVMVIDQKNRSKFLAALKAPTDFSSGHQVFICHWPVLRFIANELKEVEWFSIIGDEIQAIKNRKTQQSQVFKKLKTYYKTGLSGTWADNRPEDAWSPLNWLWPKKFTSYWGFFNYHVVQRKHNEGTCMTCENFHRRAYTEVLGVHDVETIHRLMGNGYVRRTKEEVLKDLPEKTHQDISVDLLPQQRRTYDEMRRDMLAWVGRHEDQPIAAPVVVAQLVRLQQFACAYGRITTKYKVDKETGEKLPVEVVVLDEPSSKCDAVMDIIGQTNGQVAVFGQSKQVINLLAARLAKAKIPTGILTGDTKQADRDLAVREFQAGRLRVFCSTIKAGGVGITLTAASTAIFIDRAWSPSANKQAEDRLHRVGQKNAVQIYILVARDTIDRRRNDRIELKWSWLKQILTPIGVE